MVLLLSELFGSDQTRGKTKEWILFFILHFQSFFSCFIFVQLKLFPFNRRWMLDTISCWTHCTHWTYEIFWLQYIKIKTRFLFHPFSIRTFKCSNSGHFLYVDVGCIVPPNQPKNENFEIQNFFHLDKNVGWNVWWRSKPIRHHKLFFWNPNPT